MINCKIHSFFSQLLCLVIYGKKRQNVFLETDYYIYLTIDYWSLLFYFDNIQVKSEPYSLISTMSSATTNPAVNQVSVYMTLMRVFLTTQLNLMYDIQTDIFTAENFPSFQAYANFKNEDNPNLCTSLRKPSGAIGNPTDATRTIQDYGSTIRNIIETRLILTWLTAKYYTWVSRSPSATNLAWSYI